MFFILIFVFAIVVIAALLYYCNYKDTQLEKYIKKYESDLEDEIGLNR